MQSNTRSITIDVCDYTNKTLCNLYDNTRDVSGQAFEVYVHSKRNGFKELVFQLPSVCTGENGEERNYRLDYLISDYKLKFQKKKENSNTIETDWFLISESKVTHRAFSQNYEVHAGHISNLLNTKKLDLEFSDEEGNNVGTIAEIAATIVEGTGWHLGNVATFLEEKKYDELVAKEKVRSFTASSQTGAFKMMSDLCELFDAKPIYHGEGTYGSYKVVGVRTSEEETYGTDYDYYVAQRVAKNAKDEGWTSIQIIDTGDKIGRIIDIIPMNPFSEKLDEGNYPQDLDADKVLEIHYDKNLKEITRTLNTDNIVTKLSAYGSYGDLTGLCSLQKATHEVYKLGNMFLYDAEGTFTYNGKTYYFLNNARKRFVYWSTFDFVSRSYVYDDDGHILPLYDSPKTNNPRQITILETKEETNYLPYVMDLSYYRKVGLLTDEMLEEVGEYQLSMPQYHIDAEQASLDMSEAKIELFNTASSDGGFAKLAIASGAKNTDSTNINYGQLVLTLDKTVYKDGVIYRSDYAEAKRNRFSWNTASGLTDKGMAIAGKGAVVYIVTQSQNSRTKYIKAYVKMLGNGTDNYFYDALGNTYLLHVREAYDRKEHKAGDPAGTTYFPAANQSEDTIYVALDTGKMYIWRDEYIEIKASDYVYGINDFDEPTTITLWVDGSWSSGDIVYIFSADSIAGMFGPREDAIISNDESIENTLTTGTEIHPIYFITYGDTAPSPDKAKLSYGWYYAMQDNYDWGYFYFCYGKAGDINWRYTFVSTGSEDPEVNPLVPASFNIGYYYCVRTMKLYRRMLIDGTYVWKRFDVKNNTDDRLVEEAFAVVVSGCLNQEILTKGVKSTYTYTATEELPVGNYAFKNEYYSYWLFTTDKVLQSGDKLRYNNDTKVLWQDDSEENILKPKEYTFNLLNFPKTNELEDITVGRGSYNTTTHAFSTDGDEYITGNIYIHENNIYEVSLPSGSRVVFLDSNARYIGDSQAAEFLIPQNTSYVRIVSDVSLTSLHYIRVKGYKNCFFVKHLKYIILNTTSSGERNGISDLMDRFINLADEVYITKLTALRAAQARITQANLDIADLLGDMYREGFWQQNDYAEGDENKLYADALDNLKEISHPEATYDISYLDMYGQDEVGLSVEEMPNNWIDIDITYGAHLVDPEIDINKWGYLDDVNVCYDQPYKTTIEVNTKLSMIGQQSFTDVLSHIAEVSNETRANQTLYKRSEALSGSGKLTADRLEGSIQANTVYLLGGTSNWYTDSKGNIIFESADGESAMMLSGRGLMISQEKDLFGDWSWRSAMTGKGLTADAIYTGYLSAERIEAGSITTDKLSSSIGSELDISSNVALSLFATTDGSRPAGLSNEVETPHPNEGDSYIQIRAKNGDNPAKIDIVSGGNVNLVGSNINLSSSSNINLNSGGGLIANAGTVDIKAGVEFLVNSPNFKITKNQTTQQYDVEVNGKITATSGQIAGFTIGSGTAGSGQNAYDYTYMYAGGTQTISSQSPGVYIGTDGINLGGQFVYKYAQNQGDTSYLNIAANTIDVRQYGASNTNFSIANGNMVLNANADISLNAKGSIRATSSDPLWLRSSSGIILGVGGKHFTIGSVYQTEQYYAYNPDTGNNDLLTTETVDYTYITSGKTTFDDTSVGVYLGTNGISLGRYLVNNSYVNAFSVTDDGFLTTINGKIANWYIQPGHIGDASDILQTQVGMGDSTYAFWAGHPVDPNDPELINTSAFYVQNDGTVVASNLIVVGGSITIQDNGTVNFEVSNTGVLTSIAGTIGGFTIGPTTLTGNLVGLSLTEQNTDVAIWAGDTAANKASAPFRVTQEGKLYSVSGTIGGFSIGTASLIGSNVGFIVTSTDSAVSIWAGSTYSNRSSAPFKVTRSGSITATTGKIANWSFSNNVFTNNAQDTNYVVKIDTTDRSVSGSLPTNSLVLQIGTFKVYSQGNFVTTLYNGRESKIGNFVFSDQTPAAYTDGADRLTIAGKGSVTNSGSITVETCRLLLCQPNQTYQDYLIVGGDAKASLGSYRFRIQSDGRLTATGTVSSSSSRGIKHGFTDIDTSFIDKLTPVKFTYNNDKENRRHLGLIYEDTYPLLPEICYINGDEMNINYAELTPFLLKEIQNLRKRVKELEERTKEL